MRKEGHQAPSNRALAIQHRRPRPGARPLLRATVSEQQSLQHRRSMTRWRGGPAACLRTHGATALGSSGSACQPRSVCRNGREPAARSLAPSTAPSPSWRSPPGDATCCRIWRQAATLPTVPGAEDPKGAARRMSRPRALVASSDTHARDKRSAKLMLPRSCDCVHSLCTACRV